MGAKCKFWLQIQVQGLDSPLGDTVQEMTALGLDSPTLTCVGKSSAHFGVFSEMSHWLYLLCSVICLPLVRGKGHVLGSGSGSRTQRRATRSPVLGSAAL